MPLHSDDVDNPLNLSDRDYWAEYERFKAEHPDATPVIPADQFQTYDDEDGESD